MKWYQSLSLAAILLSSVSAAKAATYQLDTSKSELAVQVFKEGVAAAIAHDHIVRATQYSGKIEFDATGATPAAISVEVKTQSLKLDEPALRKKYKLMSELSESDRQTITKNMQAADQLNVAKYPSMSFKSTSIQKQANGTWLVTGDMTMKGKTQRVSFPATVEVQGNTFHGKGKLELKQSSFGWQPYSAMLGAIRNQDRIVFHLDLYGTQQP